MNETNDKDTMPAVQGSFKSLLTGVLSPLLFLVVVTVLMMILAHYKGA